MKSTPCAELRRHFSASILWCEKLKTESLSDHVHSALVFADFSLTNSLIHITNEGLYFRCKIFDSLPPYDVIYGWSVKCFQPFLPRSIGWLCEVRSDMVKDFINLIQIIYSFIFYFIIFVLSNFLFFELFVFRTFHPIFSSFAIWPTSICSEHKVKVKKTFTKKIWKSWKWFLIK